MSIPFRLRIPRIVLDEMIVQAKAEQPNECCGLLAGLVTDEEGTQIGRVERHYPLVNAMASPVEFESDARSMFKAFRDMRSRGIDVLAVYHSHPTSPPVPSRKDLARNYSVDVVNLILSLAEETPTMRGWWLTDVDYREAEWDVV